MHQGAAQDFMGNFGGKKGGSRPRGAQVKAATASGGKKARLSHDSDDEDEEKRLTYRFVYVGDEREQRLSLLAARGVDISSELRVDAMVEEAAAVAAKQEEAKLISKVRGVVKRYKDLEASSTEEREALETDAAQRQEERGREARRRASAEEASP